MHAIRPAEGTADLEAARELFLEYAQSLDFDLCFQGFYEELASLPGPYAPPAGCLLLAHGEAGAVGTVAVRPLENGICEMKRLFVRPAQRGTGLGRALAERAIVDARLMGYRAVRLDTVAEMTAARALYDALGFRPIAPYNESPLETIRHYELLLEG